MDERPGKGKVSGGGSGAKHTARQSHRGDRGSALRRVRRVALELAGVLDDRNPAQGIDQRQIDPVIHQSLPESWPLSRVDSTLRAILRAGVFELMKKQDVPIAVIVTEYVDIAKAFYEAEEPGLVNAVLDRVAGRVRTDTKGRAR